MVGNTYTSKKLKPDRDLSSLQEALHAYQQLVTLYPSSRYASEAETRMADLREVLAEHEWMVAAFYTRNKRWRGALWRLEYLKQNYPEYSGIERVDAELQKIETKITEQEDQFKKYMEERQQKAAKQDKQKS
jgi:outer membrane assembly lipoprotein YfiO